MTLQKAINQFEELSTDTSSRSVRNCSKEFIRILTHLQEMGLSQDEIQAIESELDSLELIPRAGNERKVLRQALSKFRNFLKEQYSFTVKGYYTEIGIALGTSFGVVAGLVIFSGLERSLGIALGISLGMFLGLLIGRSRDLEAKASGKMV